MATQVITTNINLEDNAKVIKSIDSKIAELKELRDEKVAEVKEVMNKANVLELQAGAFTFKLTEITRNNVDTVISSPTLTYASSLFIRFE